MTQKSNAVLWIICFLIISQNLMANTEPYLFDGFGENIHDSFSGSNLLLHAAGVAVTPLSIRAGWDAKAHNHFRNEYNISALPGAIIGSGAVALVAGSWLYLSGRSSGDRESLGAAFAIAQAAAITVTYIVLLKVTTGRAHPTNSWNLSSQEQSEQFQFGFLRNGVTAYGWPSGHVSHTVAVTSALAYYYPTKTWLKWLGVGLSTYMIYSVTAFDSGQMHWLSDGLAGAFMGYAIGSTVGKNFRNRIDGTIEKPSVVTWIPMVSSNYLGLVATLDF